MTTRSRRYTGHVRAAWIVAAVAVVAITVVALAVPGRTQGPTLPRFVPAPAPATWRQVTLPNGTAVLSYPRSMHRISGDKDAVSAARRGPDGTYRLYLNATPRQGRERLTHWAAFRLTHLRSDDVASVRRVTAWQDAGFRGGRGACVIDDYVTRIGGNHFREIACLVRGHTSASVVVAASPAGSWTRARPVLLRAMAAYQVR